MSAEYLQIKERTVLNRAFHRLQRFATGSAENAKISGSKQSLRVGLIGVGNVVRWAYLPRFRARSSFKLAAVYDIDQAASRQVAGEFDARPCASLTEIVQDESIEAVFVCTPPQVHCEAVLASLNAGKHVLCEKPLAGNLKEATILYEAAHKAGTAHMVHFPFRFRSDTAFIAQLIRAGILGRVYHVWGTFSQGGWFSEEDEPAQERSDFSAWRFNPGGGVVLELGPHLIDFFRLCFGEIKQVQAWTKSFRPGPLTCEDASGWSLTFQCGPVAHLLTSRWATGYKNRNWFEISGSKGSLVFDAGTVKLWTRQVPRWRRLLVPQPIHADFLGAFWAAVAGESEYLPDFWDGLKNNEALEAVFRSAESEEAVALPLPDMPSRYTGSSWASVENGT